VYFKKNKKSLKMIHEVEGGYIINIEKPEGWSSFDVVKKIKKITGYKKVGHAGTLDPFASGVLLICIGKATKKIKEFMDLPKQYQAMLQLGKTTNTLDRTGDFIEEKPIRKLKVTEVKQILQSFIGKNRQKVPAYSAVKVGGRRFYSLARQGKEVPERFKDVHIYEVQLLEYREDRLSFDVRCSRGTYIRSLGLDIAQKMGTTGYLAGLVRRSIGDFRIEDSLSIEQFSELWAKTHHHENFLLN
jgi:tRNA pseudouridine55 synthase